MARNHKPSLQASSCGQENEFAGRTRNQGYVPADAGQQLLPIYERLLHYMASPLGIQARSFWWIYRGEAWERSLQGTLASVNMKPFQFLLRRFLLQTRAYEVRALEGNYRISILFFLKLVIFLVFWTAKLRVSPLQSVHSSKASLSEQIGLMEQVMDRGLEWYEWEGFQLDQIRLEWTGQHDVQL